MSWAELLIDFWNIASNIWFGQSDEEKSWKSGKCVQDELGRVMHFLQKRFGGGNGMRNGNQLEDSYRKFL